MLLFLGDKLMHFFIQTIPLTWIDFLLSVMLTCKNSMLNLILSSQSFTLELQQSAFIVKKIASLTTWFLDNFFQLFVLSTKSSLLCLLRYIHFETGVNPALYLREKLKKISAILLSLGWMVELVFSYLMKWL